jgi:hypothetical protein
MSDSTNRLPRGSGRTRWRRRGLRFWTVAPNDRARLRQSWRRAVHPLAEGVPLVVAIVAAIATTQPQAGLFELAPWADRQVLGGIVLTRVMADRVDLTVRINGPAEVALEYGTDPTFTQVLRTRPVTARAENEYQVRLHLDGLTPNTEYFYGICLTAETVDGRHATSYGPSGTVRTATTPSGPLP